MAYSIDFAPAAERQLKALRSKTLQQSIVDHIVTLETNPRPPGVEKMKGLQDQYRLRVGGYRIIYQIQDEVLTVLVLKIGHRKEIYRRRR
jgi:mRNA interferase RelE/StbE